MYIRHRSYYTTDSYNLHTLVSLTGMLDSIAAKLFQNYSNTFASNGSLGGVLTGYWRVQVLSLYTYIDLSLRNRTAVEHQCQVLAWLRSLEDCRIDSWTLSLYESRTFSQPPFFSRKWQSELCDNEESVLQVGSLVEVNLSGFLRTFFSFCLRHQSLMGSCQVGVPYISSFWLDKIPAAVLLRTSCRAINLETRIFQPSGNTFVLMSWC